MGFTSLFTGTPTQCYGRWGDSEEDATPCANPVIHVINVFEKKGGPNSKIVGQVYCCDEHFRNVYDKGLISHPFMKREPIRLREFIREHRGKCSKCEDGIVVMARDPKTLALRRDIVYCLGCGQPYFIADEDMERFLGYDPELDFGKG